MCVGISVIFGFLSYSLKKYLGRFFQKIDECRNLISYPSCFYDIPTFVDFYDLISINPNTFQILVFRKKGADSAPSTAFQSPAPSVNMVNWHLLFTYKSHKSLMLIRDSFQWVQPYLGFHRPPPVFIFTEFLSQFLACGVLSS